MKVAVLHPLSLGYVSGGVKVAVEISNLLKKKGHEVELRSVPLPTRGTVRFQINVKWIERFIHEFDADVSYLFYLPFLSKFFRTNSPIIAGMHTHTIFPEMQSEERPKSIFSLRRDDISFLTGYYILKKLKRIVNRELRKFEAIHLINPAMKVPDMKKFYIPLFVDRKFYKPKMKKNSDFKVLFVGRRLWIKGFDMFSEASKILKGKNIKFLCTGNSYGEIRGVGFVPEEKLPELYSSVHVVVYPSRFDAFGRVIIESMACGTPVITTPIEAHKALNLPLIWASNSIEVAEKISEIFDMFMNSRKKYEKLCKICREATKAYSVSRNLSKFEAMLEEVSRR